MEFIAAVTNKLPDAVLACYYDENGESREIQLKRADFAVPKPSRVGRNIELVTATPEEYRGVHVQSSIIVVGSRWYHSSDYDTALAEVERQSFADGTVHADGRESFRIIQDGSEQWTATLYCGERHSEHGALPRLLLEDMVVQVFDDMSDCWVPVFDQESTFVRLVRTPIAARNTYA